MKGGWSDRHTGGYKLTWQVKRRHEQQERKTVRWRGGTEKTRHRNSQQKNKWVRYIRAVEYILIYSLYVSVYVTRLIVSYTGNEMKKQLLRVWQNMG